jgi:hypothetical protein
MSGTTENEFENPGGNYPDSGKEAAQHDDHARRDEEPATPAAPEPTHEAVGIGVVPSPDHHGQDGGRDTLTVSEAQRTEGGLGTEQEQRLPAMSQNDASDVDKVAGIVAQTRSDVGDQSLDRIADVLRQRLVQAGVELPDDEVRELARQVSTGDDGDESAR